MAKKKAKKVKAAKKVSSSKVKKAVKETVKKKGKKPPLAVKRLKKKAAARKALLPKNLGGRPPVERDPALAKQIKTLVGLGLRQAEIALIAMNPITKKPMSVRTLQKLYARELKAGKPTAVAMVAQSLYNKAIGDSPQAVAAAKYYLECQAGWTKDAQKVDVNIKSGVLVAPQGMSVEDWVAASAAKAAEASEPGTDEEEEE